MEKNLKGERHPQPDIKKGVESYSNFRMLKYGQLCKTLTLLNCFFHVLFLMSFIYIYWDGLINLFLLGKNQPQHPETTGICPPITIASLKGKIMVNQRTFGYPMSNKLYKLDFARRCLKKTQLQWYNVDKTIINQPPVITILSVV